MADAQPDTAQEPHKLDDVMLAMDVVDTLRHEEQMLARDLSAPDREQQLIERLREIYKAQGIDVPDAILRDGVQALDDHRFSYEPRKGGLISKAYIHRGKWGKPLLVFLGMISLAWGINYAAFEAPKKNEAKRIERALSVDIPKSLQAAKNDALSIAANGDIKARINTLYGDGMAAVKAKNAKEAQRIEKALTALSADLNQSYTIRIVSRPGENSGVFRVNDKSPGTQNYYLIVEAIDASGKRLSVSIESEEDQKTKRTTIWGVRVPESVFDSVAADKRDDQIIQKSIIGRKERGFLEPNYKVGTRGGLILEW